MKLDKLRDYLESLADTYGLPGCDCIAMQNHQVIFRHMQGTSDHAKTKPLTGNELLCSVAVSQLISHVPAALLLSGFTDNARGLLIGTNLGGLGTLIASMASLISFKSLSRAYPDQKGGYLVWFTLSNLLFLIALLGLQFILGGLS